jgi:hypothetical protein
MNHRKDRASLEHVHSSTNKKRNDIAGKSTFPYLIGGNCADYWIENNSRLYVKEGTNIKIPFLGKKSIFLIMTCVLYTNFNGSAY